MWTTRYNLLNLTFFFNKGEIINEEDEPITSKTLPNNAKPTKNTKKIIDIPIYTNQTKKLIKDDFVNKRVLKNLTKSTELITNGISESWSGFFTLKKHLFPTKFYFLAGNKSLAEKVLPGKDDGSVLSISQRLRLDQAKATELEKYFFFELSLIKFTIYL